MLQQQRKHYIKEGGAQYACTEETSTRPTCHGECTAGKVAHAAIWNNKQNTCLPTQRTCMVPTCASAGLLSEPSTLLSGLWSSLQSGQ